MVLSLFFSQKGCFKNLRSNPFKIKQIFLIPTQQLHNVKKYLPLEVVLRAELVSKMNASWLKKSGRISTFTFFFDIKPDASLYTIDPSFILKHEKLRQACIPICEEFLAIFRNNFVAFAHCYSTDRWGNGVALVVCSEELVLVVEQEVGFFLETFPLDYTTEKEQLIFLKFVRPESEADNVRIVEFNVPVMIPDECELRWKNLQKLVGRDDFQLYDFAFLDNLTNAFP